jgi:hypothetical protein
MESEEQKAEADPRAEVSRGWDGTTEGLLVHLRRRGVYVHHVTVAENGDFLATFEGRAGSAIECEHLLLALDGVGMTERISEGIVRAVLPRNMPALQTRRGGKLLRRVGLIGWSS